RKTSSHVTKWAGHAEVQSWSRGGTEPPHTPRHMIVRIRDIPPPLRGGGISRAGTCTIRQRGRRPCGRTVADATPARACSEFPAGSGSGAGGLRIQGGGGSRRGANGASPAHGGPPCSWGSPLLMGV